MPNATLRLLGRFIERIKYEWIEGLPPYLLSLEQAKQARQRGDFAAAERYLTLAARARPSALSAHTKLGHVRLSLGETKAALNAFQAALRLDPSSGECHFNVAQALKQLGREDESRAHFVQAKRLGRARQTAEMPKEQRGNFPNREKLAEIRSRIFANERDIVAIQQHGFTVESWAQFRASRSRIAPQDTYTSDEVVIILDGRKSLPSSLRPSIRSVQQLDDPHWSLFVLCDESTVDHPLASTAEFDSRVNFISGRIPAFAPDRSGVFMASHTLLEPEALGWFRSIMKTANCDIVYPDHDHHVGHWRAGRMATEPALHPAFGAYDMATTPAPPAVLFAKRLSLVTPFLDMTSGLEICRVCATQLSDRGHSVAHAPLLLASVLVDDTDFLKTVPRVQNDQRSTEAYDASIAVVIPTKNQAEMLTVAVKSLFERSSRPDKISFLILNNRSDDLDMQNAFQALKSSYLVDVIDIDEPFNWSRFNNLGAERTASDIIVFANNDIEMITSHWDDEVRTLLADQSVGVIGAKLLYEDDTIQHAGIAMGAVSGRPIHEGRGSPDDDPGYLGRWSRTREASAVTGAFMAVRRTTFSLVGGFDPHLAVAYNDVDFCLRVRQRGHSVLFTPMIRAYHFESKTRGLAVTAEQIAWDDMEFRELYETWGQSALVDPYINPHWTFSQDYVLLGFRSPSAFDLNVALSGVTPTSKDASLSRTGT